MIANTDIERGAITATKLSRNLRLPLTNITAGSSGQVLVGQTNGDPAYKSVTGVVTIDSNGLTEMAATTDSVSEGDSNLYYTDARVDARIRAVRNQSDQLATAKEPGFMPPQDKVKLGEHTHDGRYYTEAEVDTSLAGKENTITRNTAFNKDFGVSASEVCVGNDGRLADDRDPNSHASSHASGGSDSVDHDALTNFVTAEHINWTAASAGTIHNTNLPALAITSVQVAADESAHLALSTAEGDIVVRSDESKSYIHNGGTAGTMADFTLLATPASAVTSVNGGTGVVTLTHDGFSDFVANEHLDWTADQGGTNIHAGNYTDTTYSDATTSVTGLMTSTDKTKLDGIATGATNTAAPYYTEAIGSVEMMATVGTGDSKFTDKNFTSTLKTKLDGVEAGAEVNVSPDWDATTGDAEILNKPTVQYTEAIADATTSVAGLMSGTDKTKLDGVAVGAEVNVLSDWDATTGDAVISNKPTIQYTSAIADATTSVAGLMSSTDKTKLDGVAVGAEVNVLADWNATTGDAVISNKPTVQYTSAIADATTSVAGLMSGTDKTKLDGVAAGAEVNVLSDWDATTGDAVISNKPNVQYTEAIADATTSVAGLMTSTDKTKLDGVAGGAEVNVQADWDAATGDAAISNKPTLGDSAAKDVGVASGDVAAGDHTHSGYASSTHPHDVMSSANSYAVGFVPSGSATHGDTYLRKDGTWETPASTVDWAAASAGTIHATNYTNTTYTSGDFDHDNLAGVNTVLHADWTTDQHGYFGYIHPDNIEFINASAGAGDAGKPVVLDAGGKIDTSMIDDGDISFVDLDDLPSTFPATIDDFGVGSSTVWSAAKIISTGVSQVASYAPVKHFKIQIDWGSDQTAAGITYPEGTSPDYDGVVEVTHNLATEFIVCSVTDVDGTIKDPNTQMDSSYEDEVLMKIVSNNKIRFTFYHSPELDEGYLITILGAV